MLDKMRLSVQNAIFASTKIFILYGLLTVSIGSHAVAEEDSPQCRLQEKVSRFITLKSNLPTQSDEETFGAPSRSLFLYPRDTTVRVSGKDPQFKRGHISVVLDSDGGDSLSYHPPQLYLGQLDPDEDVVEIFMESKGLYDGLEFSFKLTIDNGFRQYQIKNVRAGLIDPSPTIRFNISDLPVISGRAVVEFLGEAMDGSISLSEEFTLILMPHAIDQLSAFAEAHLKDVEEVGYCFSEDGERRYPET